MKLLVRKLWFRGNLDDTVQALFKIPQVQEQFKEGYNYDGEMRPRGLCIFPRFWQAERILELLPKSEKDVYLVLTSMDLKGDFGRINGRGHDKKALASNEAFIDGYGKFNPYDIEFNAIAFHELGHSLGLVHHEPNDRAPCVMTMNSLPSYRWQSLNKIKVCDSCYKKMQILREGRTSLNQPSEA